ncbi:MAG: hypothetical protein MJZ79_05015 [Paludibacteraceae bacterium]|nr:hypothetical protein [Paludibacteraceae bacterium]
MDFDELISDIDDALDDLDYGISWNTNVYESNGFAVCEISFDYDDFDDDVPDYWDEEVEDELEDVISDWGGSYYWEDNTIIYSIPL